MIFRYKKYGPGVLRPVIPIQIAFQNRFVNYEVLVDSGADVCIFDAEIGELLAIDIRAGEKKRLAGVTGAAEFYYVHPVVIKTGDVSFPVQAGFLPGMARLGYGVVGEQGFFTMFIATFDLLKEEIELIQRR